MKKTPFKITKTQLSNEEMQFITAGNNTRDDIRQTNGRSNKMSPKSLPEAYRRLSRRECEVLEKIAEGKTNREIAGELFIAKGTVENHITRIGKALGVQGRGSVRQWVARQKESG